MTEIQLTELIGKYLEGNCTESEKKLVEDWYGDFEKIPISFLKGDTVAINNLRKESFQELREQIAARKQEEQNKIVYLPKRVRQKWWIAAAVLLILFLGTISYLGLHKNVEKRLSPASPGISVYKDDVAPGGDKATLTLANGTSINLDSAKVGQLSNLGYAKVFKTSSGQLKFKVLPEISKFPKEQYNILNTPQGGVYEIILADGTKVWLNSASSLRFPVAFVGSQRDVYLSGEAYFEVVQNSSMPFEVHVNNMEVKVLGTHFDVMAYNDESAVKTTLLEGSVQVSDGNQKVMILPGQQATVSRKAGDAMEVKPVNVTEVIGWKNGLFIFRNTDLQTVMHQLARWYAVTISYEGNVNGQINGMISRNTNLSQVLDMLTLVGGTHFKIEGRHVTVMP